MNCHFLTNNQTNAPFSEKVRSKCGNKRIFALHSREVLFEGVLPQKKALIAGFTLSASIELEKSVRMM
jgi:hypothetical protein